MMMGMMDRCSKRAFTLLELAISLALVAMLLAVLVPTLSNARQTAHREQCANNQRRFGEAWQTWLADHDQQFPHVPVQPGWFYAGMRFSSADGSAFPDYQRPLNAYLPLARTRDFSHVVCACPADQGITDPDTSAGTGGRTAFRSFGNSYRANAVLMDPSRLISASTASLDDHDSAVEAQSDRMFERSTEATPQIAPVADELRGLAKVAITASPSRLVVMGDPVWYEVAEDTGRSADWHGQRHAGNLLFLDGSVRFLSIRPRRIVGPILFDPMPAGAAPAVPVSDPEPVEVHP